MGCRVDNLLNILNLFNQASQTKNTEPEKYEIPKEILDQYPYGKFPNQYTKNGQEDLRKASENRYSYIDAEKTEARKNESNLDISSILPLIELMSGKQQPKDMMKILSKMLFKENKEFEKIFDLITPKNKPQELINNSFPNTNKVKISTLRRIDE